MGNLLPRDFLERQPKRWQKSQKKRRVLGTLKKMKEKREKVVQRTIDQAHRDAGHVGGAKAPEGSAVTKGRCSAAAGQPLHAIWSLQSWRLGCRAGAIFAGVVKIPEGVVLARCARAYIPPRVGRRPPLCALPHTRD